MYLEEKMISILGALYLVLPLRHNNLHNLSYYLQ